MPLQTIPLLELLCPLATTGCNCRALHKISKVIFSAALVLAFTIPLHAATSAIKTIPVGTNPGQIVVNPGSHTAFIVNQGSNSVSLLDTQQLKVKKVITVGASPIGIAVNPAANKVYIANSGSGTITPISGTSALTPWTVGGTPSAVVVDSVINQLYVMDTSLQQIDILNAGTGVAIATIPTSLQPTAMTVNIATHAVFVACSGSSAGSVVVIDGVHHSVITTVAVAKGSTSISVDPVTDIVIVESPSTNTHTAINAGSGYSVQSQTLSGPLGSAYGEGLFLVSESGSTGVGFTGGDTGVFTLGNFFDTTLLGGAGLTVNLSSNQMVVLYPSTDTAYLIDLTNPLFPQAYHELTAGSNVAGAAFDPLAGRLFITNSTDNTVSVFNFSDSSPLQLVDAYEGPYGGNSIDYNYIDSNPATGMMYTLRLGNLFAINEAAAGSGANGTSQNSAGVSTIPLASTYSACVAVNAATNKIYVGDYLSTYVVDGSTNIATALSLPANTQIRSFAVNNGTNEIVAWDYYTGNVLILDGSTNAVVKTIPTGSGSSLGPVQVDAAKDIIYLGGLQAVYVINPASGTLVATLPIAGQAMSAALNAPKSLLYVVDNFAKLTVINTSTNTVVTTISLPYGPNAVAVNPLSGNYYVALNFDVYEYSGSTNKVLKHFSSTSYPAISEAVSLAVNPLTDLIYVGTGSGTSSSVLAVIDERTGTVSAIPPLYDAATWALNLDLGSGVLGGAGYSYTNLFFPSSSVAGSDVPITVAGTGVVDSYTIASSPIFRTGNTQPSFKISATSSFGSSATSLVPTKAFYQVDGWQGTWKTATLKLQSNTLTSSGTIKVPSVLTTGRHILYVYADVGDVATIQAGLPTGNSVANSPVISPVAAIVFTVEK
jgi:YVTN family beta-propeller protein